MIKLVRSMACIIAIVFGLGLLSPVHAEETDGGKDWKFVLAPFYLWAVSLEGDIASGPAENSVSVDFGEIFDDLEAVFTVHFETIFKEHYGFLIDINYINISGSGTTPISPVDVDLEANISELSIYYSWPSDVHTFDVHAGILYSSVDADLNFTNLPREPSLSESWVDPIVGARWIWRFADKWRFAVRGNIGGGASSDLTWQGFGTISYQPWKYADIVLGYRAVGIDYESGEGPGRFVYDITMAGPVAGISFKW